MKHKPDLQTLNRIFKRYPGIQAVYVFGSSAARRTRADSDLDLAIVPRHPQVRAKKLDILADLARVGISDFDLVFLDTDDIVLKYEAVRLNQLVYQAKVFAQFL
jgi:predicted nucleotidyltransferase